MNDYLLSLILGIVEGLTEFLPVSSTAHLRIAQALLGVDLEDGYWKMFAIVIQLGAILCLPIFFRRRIASFFATFPQGRRGDRTVLTHPLTLTAIAFVCTAVPSLLLIKVMGADLELEFGPERAVNGVTRRLAAVSLAAERLGFKAEVGLDEGLARLVSWWREQRQLGGAS